MRMDYRVKERDGGAKLGPFLRRQGFSVHLIRRLKYQPEGLLVNGARARTNRVLAAGDAVAVTLPGETGYSAVPQPMALRILFESDHALVFDKPPGLVVHPTRSHKEGTLANGYCALMEARGEAGAVFRPVGRLDGDTSGLQLCAKNPLAATALAAGLHKIYFALAEGRLPAGEGEIDAPLAPCPDSAVRQQVAAGGRPSLTRYRVLLAGDAASLLAVRPETGRTHQIRAHLAHIGHPLLGDGLYGGSRALLGRHGLHCANLRFTEPDGNIVTLFLPPPPDICGALAALGWDDAAQAAAFEGLGGIVF